MPDNIQEFILKQIEKKGKLPDNIDINTFNYIDSGYIDSMAIIKFAVELESKFDIEITDDDIISKDFKTVGGLVSLIKRKQNG